MTTLSPEVAAALANSKGCLGLDGLKTLSAGAAQALAEYKGRGAAGRPVPCG